MICKLVSANYQHVLINAFNSNLSLHFVICLSTFQFRSCIELQCTYHFFVNRIRKFNEDWKSFQHSSMLFKLFTSSSRCLKTLPFVCYWKLHSHYMIANKKERSWNRAKNKSCNDVMVPIIASYLYTSLFSGSSSSCKCVCCKIKIGLL